MSPRLSLEVCYDAGLMHTQRVGFAIQRKSVIVVVRFRCKQGLIFISIDVIDLQTSIFIDLNVYLSKI